MDLYIVAPSGKVLDYIVDFNSSVIYEKQFGLMGTFIKGNEIRKWIELGFRKIFVDSGAFSVYNSGKKVDIEKYITFLNEVKNNIAYSINLDVIEDKTGYGSLKNWEYLKNRGLYTIPVYHLGEDYSILDSYCKEADYIGLGGTAGSPFYWKKWSSFYYRVFQDYPHHRFHALGVNDISLIQKYPWHSCDALTYRVGQRFGEIISPWGRWKLGKDKGISEVFANLSGLKEWLETKGFNYPFSDDFDYSALDIFNLQYLYEKIVLKVQNESLSQPIHIF